MSLYPVHRRFRLSLALVCSLQALALSTLCMSAAHAQAVAGTAAYDIPSQPLADALRQYSRISGEQVTHVAVDTVGRRSTAIIGTYSAADALQAMLKGTGLVAVRTGSRTLMLQKQPSDTIVTDALNVQGANPTTAPDSLDARFGGYYGLGSDDIAARPGGNRNITEQLRGNPVVQFSRSGTGGNGLAQGEIRPDKVSLHGTRSYQNLFRLDGQGINSDIDPVDPGNGTVIAYNPGDEQGAYLDSRLVERIEVLDANVSARHGGFTGGVIDATSRSWSGGQGGHLFFRQTESGWNRTYVDDRLSLDSRYNSFNAPARFQPDYRKREYGGWAETGLTGNLGLVLGASRRDSDIPMIDVGGRYYELDNNGGLVEHRRDEAWRMQSRTSDNLNAKISWYPSDRTTLYWSVFRSAYDEDAFQNGVANSAFRRKHASTGTQLEWLQDLDAGALSARVGWRDQREVRESDRDYLVTFNSYADFNHPASFHNGGIGSLDSFQKTATADVSMRFNTWDHGAVRNTLEVGVGLSNTRARSRRERTYFNNSFNDYGFGPPALRVDAFFAGQARASYTSSYFYAEDTIDWGRLGVRPGVRIERDDFVGRTNIAPRLAADWSFTDDESSVLSAGINRYYGRSMLTWVLYEAQNAGLKHCYFGCVPNVEDFGGTWLETPDYEGLNSLKTPYSDEWTVAFRQIWGGSVWNLQYVDRKHHDEVRSRPKYPGAGFPRSSIREFISDSSGMSRSASLRVANARPLAFLDGRHNVSLSVAWQESRTDTALELGYTQLDLTRRLDPNRVWYRGHIIDARDLPATDFNAPWKAVGEWSAEWANLGLSLNNILTWQNERTQPFRYGAGNGYVKDPDTGLMMAKYDVAQIGGGLRWDMRVQWKPAFAYGASLMVDINNVLDRRNQSDVLALNDQVYRIYEPGRQFWVSVGYDF